MGEELIRPYEISLWENQLIIDNGESYYKENKIAVIGSNTMTAPNRVYSPIFKKNVNGEKTLTFSLAYKYYDDEVGDFVMNPFVKYLINERIVKLKYDGKWYDFVIKECEEDSENYEFKYTASDAFIQELSKIGYNVTFNTELNNNLGTVTQLGEAILKNTDWKVDKENSDILQQKISEPIYRCNVLEGNFTALDIDSGEEITIEQDEIIWVFYSYIANQVVDYVQFLKNTDIDKWTYDDNNAIIGPNYRIMTPVEYGENFIYVGDARIVIETINMESQGYRLVYNQQTTYDPIMGRTVNEYIANYEYNKQRIYEYDDYIYTSSNIVASLITNGTNFNVYNDGSILGWSNTNYISGDKLRTYKLVTFPKLDYNAPLVALDDLRKIRGYVEFDFTDIAGTSDNNYANAFFNSGFTDNAVLVEHISKGDKYVFRIRYSEALEESEEGTDLIHVDAAAASVRAIVAKYTLKQQTLADGTIVELKQVDNNCIYLDFDDVYEIGNNIIEGGQLSGDNKLYIIDNVVQTPSMKYLYKNSADEEFYVWDADNELYVLYDSDTYCNYLYTVATAQLSMTNEELTDIGNRFGVFLYDDSNESHYAYVEEVEIFKYIDSGDGTPIMPGNAPEAKSQKIETFYVKPEEGMRKEQINTYNSLSDLAADLGLSEDKIISIRNENCEKILSIEEQKSNCFNLLQTLCETFECWIDLRVDHDDNGAIKLNENHKPNKVVVFKEYIGKDNFSGFRYGINLKSIRRSLDSSEFVTKLIVGQSASEYTNSGVLSITEANSNPSKESYIINLNYYLNQGLIESRSDCLSDINKFNFDIAALNRQLVDLNQSYMQATAALTNITSDRNVYIETYEVAIEDYAKALAEFEQVVGMSYEAYREKEDADASILENQTVAEIVGRIYNASTILNNYSGIVTNVKNEYNYLNYLVNGAQIYNVVVSTVEPQGQQEGSTKLTLSHYIEGFECVFTDDDGRAPCAFKSKVNQKDFFSTTVYSKLRINKIPENYNIEYIIDGETVIYDEPTAVSFDIRSIVDGGLSKRFRLVPNEEIAEDIGYKGLIERTEKEKQERINQFNTKYSKFLREGTWESTNYIDSELYYLDAVEVSNTSAQPKLSYEIGVVEISEIEGFENYSFDVGDKTYIEDTEYFGYTVETIGGIDYKTPVQEEVVISEVEWHLDEPQDNVIVVQNYKTQFEDLFQRISATVQNLSYNQASYTRAANILDINGRIKAGILARSLNAIAGSVSYSLTGDGIVQVVEDGLLIQDLTSMGNSLIIKSGGISLSTDGGLTWTKVLGPEGFNADVINAGTINTNQILIMDGENPSFRWDKAGLNAYGYGKDGYDLTTYVRFDKYGLYGIKDGENYVCTSLDDIKDKAHFGVTWDGFFIKNSYTNGYVSISSDNDFQVIRNLNNREIEKIKIGALSFDRNGNPIKYGIRIRNDEDAPVMETGDDGNLTISGTINAFAGNIGGMSVDEQKLKMKTIVFEPSKGIYSTNLVPGHSEPIYEQQWVEDESYEEGGYWVTVQVGVDTEYEPVFYISDVDGSAVFNQIKARGEINATSGNFIGSVTVGKDVANEEKTYIEINGLESLVKTSNYNDDKNLGWLINSDGNAVFNNISVRGAIKTAVFEYSEIQAVGGTFLFRPSSTIKTAEVVTEYELTEDTDIVEGKTYYIYNEENGTYIIVENPVIEELETYYEISNRILNLTVEKPLLFAENDWCKISNYADDTINSSDATGLAYIYKISQIVDGTISLTNVNENLISQLDDVVGGALINFGKTDGSSNYGIGINSSDDFVNLPRRAISLFESEIKPNDAIKVSYNYHAILGTLPELPYQDTTAKVSQLYHNYLKDTQGIFTDNMYIGDNTSYLAFYTDTSLTPPKRKLTLHGAEIWMTYDDTEQTLDQVIAEIEAGEGLILTITSSNGYVFTDSAIVSTLTAHLYKEGEEITPYSEIQALGYQINWYKNDVLDSRDGVDRQNYLATGTDSIRISAKLEDISN